MGRHILLIGIGQTGCTVADLFSNKMNKDGIYVNSIAIDTDEILLETLVSAEKIPMTDSGDLESVVEALGAENIKDWFPCEWENDCTAFVKTLKMNNGANQWRMKAFLSFASFLSKKKSLERFTAILDASISVCEEEDALEIYTVASLAGGTGSALFLPIALYVKKYLEGKGRKLTKSIAMLAMPDIYENCYSAEQRVKSYANAYAALREYNAVLLSSCSQDGHLPIDFKIGKENGIPELLFDSERSQYKQPSANPFDKVYLFERVSGVTSASAHAEIIADVIVSFCKCYAITCKRNEQKQKVSDAIFGGVSLVKISYPIDRTIEYIVKRQLSEIVSYGIVRVHKETVTEAGRRCGESHLYGGTFAQSVEQYAESFISVMEKLFYEEDSNLALIGCSPKDFSDDCSDDCIWRMNFLSGLSELIDGSLACDGVEKIDAIITAPIRAKARKKRKDQTTSIDIMQAANDCGEWLEEVYRHGLCAAINRKQEFIDVLFTESKDRGIFSISENILKWNGEYLHPIYALLRLCLVRRDLSNLCKKIALVSAEDESNVDNAKLSDAMFEVEPCKSFRTKYANLGAERFRLLAKDGVVSLKKTIDDRILFVRDLGEVFHRLIDKLRGFYYNIVLESVEALILEYRSFFGCVCRMMDDLNTDVKLALIGGVVDSGNSVNVGTTIHRKENLYAEYIKTYVENHDAVSEYITLFGKLTHEKIRAKTEDVSFLSVVEWVFEGVETLYKNQLCASELYRRENDRNVLNVMLDPRSEVTLSKVLKGRNVPLHIKMPDVYSEYGIVRSETMAIFDEKIRIFIENNRESFGEDEPIRFVEKLMYRAGEYEGIANFANNIGEKNMLLRHVTDNLRLNFIEVFDELSDDHIGYKFYRKALHNMAVHTTKMWNPHLMYSRNGATVLPFINPDMQKQYETSVAKAIVYAMYLEELSLSDFDGKGNVFFLHQGMEVFPMLIDEEMITADAPDRVILWAYRHPEWVSNYAEKFDTLMDDELRHIPVQGWIGSNHIAVDTAIRSSQTIEMVRDILIPFVVGLFLKGNASVDRFAIGMAELGQGLLFAFCKKGFNVIEMNFVSFYNQQLDLIVAALIERYGTNVVMALLERLNELGLFRSYDIEGETHDYCLESCRIEVCGESSSD